MRTRYCHMCGVVRPESEFRPVRSYAARRGRVLSAVCRSCEPLRRAKSLQREAERLINRHLAELVRQHEACDQMERIAP